ncbi:MAG: hypothetical protein BWY15_02054 [Firmicutes bacterium ADurb.Bin193]|nr:MAG: hypothetical protein BWY15_02054 [Firmicutes bacterium ADurb.Bin193]
MKQHKNKIITAFVILAVLGAAFWWGGNAPGLKGVKVSSDLPSATETPVSPATPSAQPVGQSSAPPSASPPKAPSPTDTARPEPSGKPPEGAPSRSGGGEKGLSAQQKVETANAIAQEGASEGIEKGSAKYSQLQGMRIEEATGKDKYLTDPIPEGKPAPVEPQDAVITDKALTCTLSVRCDTILQNMKWLDPAKAQLVPDDGVIFAPKAVTFYEGESVFNVLVREMKKNKIHMEFENTPIYNSAYIEGIHNLYEFDCGELSGWMYKVNGWFPNYGCSRYQLKDQDKIEWVYTCNLGVDVGGYYAAAGD